MLFGYNTNGFAHHRLEDVVVILAELGYRSIALTLDYHSLNPFDPDLARQLSVIKSLLEKHSLRSVVETGARFLLDTHRKHQPTLLSRLPARDKRLDFLKRAVDIAAELGSDAVSFWSGASGLPASSDEQLEQLTECCRQLCRYAEAHRVRLAFEPEPGMFIDTMTHFAELRERVDHALFGLTIDIGHLHCLGEVPIADHLIRWREQLWNIHIEDMRQGVHDHLMFGEGEINFGEVLAALKQTGYGGGVHVELSRHSHNAVETARRSLEFLRQTAAAGLEFGGGIPIR